MAEFTVTLTDSTWPDKTEQQLLDGITAARLAHNENLQPVYDEFEVEITPHPDYTATSQDYVQWVMARACRSYSNQYNT